MCANDASCLFLNILKLTEVSTESFITDNF